MEKSDGSCLETEKIGKLMGKYAIPCIISLLVGAVALILVEFFPQQLINVFGAASESVYYTDNLFAENIFLLLFRFRASKNAKERTFSQKKRKDCETQSFISPRRHEICRHQRADMSFLWVGVETAPCGAFGEKSVKRFFG